MVRNQQTLQEDNESEVSVIIIIIMMMMMMIIVIIIPNCISTIMSIMYFWNVLSFWALFAL
jgi:hypothetical protein